MIVLYINHREIPIYLRESEYGQTDAQTVCCINFLVKLKKNSDVKVFTTQNMTRFNLLIHINDVLAIR